MESGLDFSYFDLMVEEGLKIGKHVAKARTRRVSVADDEWFGEQTEYHGGNEV